MWRGERCRETLERAPTPPNIKYAERLVAEIRRKIEIGMFVYADYFPNSPRAKEIGNSRLLFGDLSDTWLETKGRLAAATLSQYTNALKFWKEKLGAKKPIDEISHATVSAVVGSHPWPSAKLCNNYLIPLRGVFALAGREIKTLDNPMQGVSNAKQQSTVPDPLSAAEMEKILEDMRKRYDEQVFNYFEFAFMTGMRPEELIALRWDDIDWNHGTIRVCRAKSFRGQIKELKTYEVRDVDLVDRAVNVLTRQKVYTFMKRAETPEIFENPITGMPWHDERSQRDHYWKPSLTRCGIRARRAYQTRHTYATNGLMGGVNPAYLARQMGHSNAQMFFKKYAKWIDGADRGREKAKLEQYLSSEFVPNLSPESDFVGRLDWTRTNASGETLPHKKRSS